MISFELPCVIAGAGNGPCASRSIVRAVFIYALNLFRRLLLQHLTFISLYAVPIHIQCVRLSSPVLSRQPAAAAAKLCFDDAT